jgi:hypothetical protein
MSQIQGWEGVNKRQFYLFKNLVEGLSWSCGKLSEVTVVEEWKLLMKMNNESFREGKLSVEEVESLKLKWMTKLFLVEFERDLVIFDDKIASFVSKW